MNKNIPGVWSEVVPLKGKHVHHPSILCCCNCTCLHFPSICFLQIASTAKKLWDVQDSGEENQGMTSGIFFGEQWRETAWGPSVPHMTQSEHAVSQPIMVQRPAKGGNFNTPSESQSVLSPRSADGVGLSMVEYVLASSPGGQELDAQIIKAGFVSILYANVVSVKPSCYTEQIS